MARRRLRREITLMPPDDGPRRSAVRISDSLKVKIDKWAKRQTDQPRRSEAVSRLVLLAFKFLGR